MGSVTSSGWNWLAGWNYRKSCTITAASGAGTNYQIKIPVCYNAVKFDHLYEYNPLDFTAFLYGGGGVLHPTVLYFPNGMGNGNYKYWMMYTPYSSGSESAEQPCIVRSNDGINWTADGITNPVITGESNNYFPDPNFIYVSAYGTWFTVVTKQNYTDSDGRTISLFTSTNGTTWTDKGTLINGSAWYEQDDTTHAPFVTEPAIIYDNNWFYVWYCVLYNSHISDQSAYNMRRSVCLAKFQWNSTSNAVTNFERNGGNPIFTPVADSVYFAGTGHIAIAKYNGVYYLFGARRLDGSSAYYDICLWSCTNRIFWDTSYGAVVTHGVSGSWDSLYVYRGGPVTDGEGNIVTIQNRPYIYFSGSNGGPNSIGFAYMDNGFTYMDCVLCNGHCNPDFTDIRFTDDDGSTLLDYWNETTVNSNYSIFWVEVADDLSSSNRTIYMYYGKSGAITTSNGANTFQLFDDFNDGSLNNVTLWTKSEKGSGAVSEPSGTDLLLHVHPGVSSDSAGIISTATFTSNISILVKRKQASNNGYYVLTSLGSGAEEDENGGSTGYWLWTLKSGYSWRQYELNDLTGTNGLYFNSASGGTTGLNISGVINNDAGNYHIYESRYYSTSARLQFLIDGTVRKTASNSTFLSNNKHLMVTQGSYYGGPYGNDTYVDYVIVRKFVSPEPSHGSWGSEEARALYANDGFENFNTNGWWASYSGGGTMVQSSAQKISGSYSLLVTSTGSAYYAYAFNNTATISTNFHYGIWIYPPSGVTYYGILVSEPYDGSNVDFRTGLLSNSTGAYLYVGDPTTSSQTNITQIPYNKWTEIDEYYVRASGRIDVYVNGVNQSQGTWNTGVIANASPKTFYLGDVSGTGTQYNGQIYYDDLLINNATEPPNG